MGLGDQAASRAFNSVGALGVQLSNQFELLLRKEEAFALKFRVSRPMRATVAQFK